MTDTDKQKKLIEDLILDLKSEDPKTLTSALKRVRSKGNEAVIPYLFKLIEGENTPKIKAEAKKIILELKTTAAIPELLNQLQSENPEARELALGAFWQTGFNAFEHIDAFVLAASKGTYMEAVEAYTIIDNLDGPFVEEPIIEGQLILKQYFSDNNTDDEKYELMKSIALALDNYEQTI
jgi:HEAT repeat protein